MPNEVAGRQGFEPIPGELQASRDVPETGPTSHELAKRVEWLGGRDSNPDKQSQSLLSYR